MLIQFVVENFLSFRDKQILSMRAPEPGAARIGAAFDQDKQQTVRAGGEEILRCAALYGANASGKSNLVRALDFVRTLILEGTASNTPIARRPFKLDPACSARPSRFELIFVHDDVLYSYGFALDSERIHAEWLYRGPEDSDELLFRRELEPASDRYVFEVGDALASDPVRKQFYEFLHQGTRAHQLFLHEAQERNAPELAPPLQWLSSLCVLYPSTPQIALAALVETDPDFRSFLAALLARVDTGIGTIDTRRVPLPHHDLARLMSGQSVRGGEGGGFEEIRLITSHGGGQDAVMFELDEESSGTQRLMQLARVLYRGEHGAGRLFVIDELDRSLHPMLTRFFLQEFVRAGSAASPNQLICTTHDTDLLDVDLLPPSSIWFVEKDREGSSRLYSLDELDESQLAALRDETEDGYLAGRSGALPFFGNRQRSVQDATRRDDDRLAHELLLQSQRNAFPPRDG